MVELLTAAAFRAGLARSSLCVHFLRCAAPPPTASNSSQQPPSTSISSPLVAFLLPPIPPGPPRSHHTSLPCKAVAPTSHVPQHVWQVLRGLCRGFEVVSPAVCSRQKGLPFDVHSTTVSHSALHVSQHSVTTPPPTTLVSAGWTSSLKSLSVLCVPVRMLLHLDRCPACTGAVGIVQSPHLMRTFFFTMY